MKVKREIKIKTVINSIKDRNRLKSLTEFTDYLGHKCENVDQTTLKKMVKRVEKRKKNHSRGNVDYVEKQQRKVYSTVSDAKGKAGKLPEEKRFLYSPVSKQTAEEFRAEIDDVIAEEKRIGMIVGIINRKRENGTLECIHNLEHKWTSMRLSDDKRFQTCQRCGLRIMN